MNEGIGCRHEFERIHEQFKANERKKIVGEGLRRHALRIGEDISQQISAHFIRKRRTCGIGLGSFTLSNAYRLKSIEKCDGKPCQRVEFGFAIVRSTKIWHRIDLDTATEHTLEVLAKRFI